MGAPVDGDLRPDEPGRRVHADRHPDASRLHGTGVGEGHGPGRRVEHEVVAAQERRRQRDVGLLRPQRVAGVDIVDDVGGQPVDVELVAGRRQARRLDRLEVGFPHDGAGDEVEVLGELPAHHHGPAAGVDERPDRSCAAAGRASAEHDEDAGARPLHRNGARHCAVARGARVGHAVQVRTVAMGEPGTVAQHDRRGTTGGTVSPNIATNEQVGRDALEDFVRPRHKAVLLTTRADGRPQASPVTCGMDAAGRIVVSTYPERAKVANARCQPDVSVVVLSDDFDGPWVQVDGTAEVLDLPEALDGLVEYFRVISGDHPDWDEYRAAMVRQGKALLRITPTRWGPVATGGFPPRLAGG